MNDLTGLLIGIAPVLTALTWCNVRDRRTRSAPTYA